MQTELRHHCVECMKDVEDLDRIERRNSRFIGDRIKSGQAGAVQLVGSLSVSRVSAAR